MTFIKEAFLESNERNNYGIKHRILLILLAFSILTISIASYSANYLSTNLLSW